MKNKIPKLLSLLLCAALAVGLIGTVTAAAEDSYYHGNMKTKMIWNQVSDGGKYNNHRIPGIVVTKKDTVIIYCEARTGNTQYSLKDSGDWCLMDIYIQRSTDKGETFGDPIYIAKGTQQFATVNNPVMIVGNDNTLHMLYCRNYSIQGGGLWYTKSTDDGLTWSTAREVSQFAESVPHDAFAFGPTHGICTVSGRLMTAVWLVPAGGGRDGNKTDHGPSKAYTFYSDDNGETWSLSAAASENTNETDIVQLSDGTIMLNSRSTPYRKVTTSPDGVSQWTATYNDEQLTDPGCCGGMVTVDLKGYPYALLFVNCDNKTDRRNVTVKCSFDDGKTCAVSKVIDQYNGGYSDIAVDSGGCVYVLFENDTGKTVKLARLSFTDTFCTDDSSSNGLTSLDFDNPDNVGIGETKNVSSEVSNGCVNFTMTAASYPKATVDVESLTKCINLTKLSVMAVKMKATTAAGGELVNDAVFRCGTAKDAANNRRSTFSVKADGEWHYAVVDLSGGKTAGNLYSIKLEFFADSGSCSSGDTVSIDSIAFYSSVAEANKALGITEPENSGASAPDDSTTIGDAPSSTAPGGNDESSVTDTPDGTEAPLSSGCSGCGSAALYIQFLTVLACGFIASALRKPI